MWKSWKEKIIDFFYEEVEPEEKPIDLPRRVESKHAPVKEKRSLTTEKRTASVASRHVDTKVAYQYPKSQTAPFRFPVISDQSQPVNNRLQKTGHHTKQQSIQRKLQARTEAYATHQRYHVKSRGMKRKQHQKELEEVPAYVRRRLEMEQQREREQLQKIAQEKQQEKEEQQEVTPSTTINLEAIEHTKPEELDEVFRKRDGIRKQTEVEDSEAIIPDKTPSSPSAPTNAFFDIVEKESQDASSGEDAISSVDVEAATTNEPETMATENSHEDVNESNSIINEDQGPIEHMQASTINKEQAAPLSTEKKDIPNYLLNDPITANEDDSDWLIEQQILLEDTFQHFHIDATVVNVTQGPSVTRFEVQPALGVKVSKIRNLADDLKLNLAAKDIRIEAPIPGKNTIGIEVPNQYPKMVTLQKIIETKQFKEAPSPLTIALGLSIEGDPLITNIDKMPHGLIAGATGSGKSVCINTVILSLLYKADYREVKFLLIDPKMVELTPYNGIPHLLSPVITDTKAATAALKWAVAEMESRYEKFVEAGVRNVQKYNEKMMKAGKPEEKMPYIVIIIDELADLMMVSPQEVEDAICRIAQKARACGMHLLLATQRPSVDVITGLIKANIPTRIAFSVSSQIDSRTILDTNGAEKLLGKGDMLFVENGANKSVRLQGPFVSDEEIDRVASYSRSIAEPQYLFEQEQLLLEVEHDEEDELLTDVITFVVNQHQASTSLLQRRFRIGYNRAARLIDSLEDKGIISAQNGSKPRDVLVTQSQIDDLI